MWHEVVFAIPAGSPAAKATGLGPDTPFRHDRLRKLIARLSTERSLGLPSWFFGYGETGTQGRPDGRGDTTVAFRSTASGVAITAIGPRACELLVEKTGAIHAALIGHAGALIAGYDRSGPHGASLTTRPMRFELGRVMLGSPRRDSWWNRTAQDIRDGKGDWVSLAQEQICWAIVRGLMRQTWMLLQQGDDVDNARTHPHAVPMAKLIERAMRAQDRGERPWAELGPALFERLAVHVDHVGGHTYQAWPQAHGNGCLVLKEVGLSMNLALEGPWWIGGAKAIAKGDLRMKPARMATNPQAEVIADGAALQ